MGSTPDQFDASFSVFLQEAGAMLADFMGMAEPPSHVPVEVLDDAAASLCALADAEPESLAAARQEMLAQALEELWVTLLSPSLTLPGKRAEMLAWLEEQTGRPMEFA